MILKFFLFALIATLCAASIYQPNILRPCALSDHRCITDRLRSASNCRLPRGFAPALLVVPRARFEAAAFNSSYVDRELVVRGLDRCTVAEFYINRQTRGGVIALECRWLNFESNREMYQHHSLKEDEVFHYWINGSYPLIRLTTSFAKFDQLDLCQEFTFADVAALPVFDINPEDEQTENYLTKDLSALNIYERETFLYRAKLLARTFINSVLCDFGCNY